MDTIRIGLIGAGANTSARHIPGFRAQPDIEVAGVCNRTRASGQRVAEESGVPRVYESVDELLDDPAIDAVCIGTWPYRHREFTVASLKAGKHVLCEARMASDAVEAAEMLAVSEANPGLVAQLVPAPFDFRLGPTIQRLLAEGAIGELTEVHVTVLNGSGLDPAAPLHWRNRRDYSGNNIMMLGIYAEIVQRWLGDTSRLMAHGRINITERTDPETGLPRAIDVPDSFGILAELANGARLTYEVSAVAAGAPFSGIVIHGRRGTLRWTPDDRASWALHGAEMAALEPDPGTDRGWRVEEDFIRSIREGVAVSLTSFADGLKYMRFTDACQRSWREGVAVSL